MVQLIRQKEDLKVVSPHKVIDYQERMVRKLEWLWPFEAIGPREIVFRSVFSSPEEEGGRRPISLYLREEKREKALIPLVEAFQNLWEELELHLLDPAHVLSSPQYLFWTPEQKSLRVLYLPFEAPLPQTSSFPQSLSRALFEKCCKEKWQDPALLSGLVGLRQEAKGRAGIAPPKEAPFFPAWPEERRTRPRSFVLEEETPKPWWMHLKERFPIAFKD